MEKRNKIRDWEAERDVLNDKLDLCEEKLRNQKQDQRPDDFKQRLASAKVRDKCLNNNFLVFSRMVELLNGDCGMDVMVVSVTTTRMIGRPEDS